MTDIDKITRWSALFDELCNRAGFYDSSLLASKYCELANGGAQREFETVVRNINNWRSGRHIPRLRSVKILEQLLDVQKDSILLGRWQTLYQKADDETELAAEPPSEAPPGRTESRPRLPLVAMTTGGLVLFGMGLATGLVAGSGWRPWGGAADSAPIVVWKPDVTLKIGESRVIYAVRGDCGKLPQEWPDVSASLPTSGLGAFADGGLARRNSKFCKGVTPARAILYTAKKPGSEELRIQGDFLKVTVTD